MKEIDLGFLIARFSHFYAVSPDAVLETPIRRFWFMNGCIERIMAQLDLRALTVAAASQSGEGAKQYREKLCLDMGEIYVMNEFYDAPPVSKRDEAGFQALKDMS